MKTLTDRELRKLAALKNGWKLQSKHTKLVKAFSFPRHIDALIFIARITVSAELLKHHPDMYFTYCSVKITLTTHELKGLSQADVQLMQRIERLSTKPVTTAS